MTIPMPGLYKGCSRAVYDSWDAINQSILKIPRKGREGKTWAHARYEMLHPKEPTPALMLGQAFHTALLEPSRFEKEYSLPPIDPSSGAAWKRTSNAGKQAWSIFEAENPGVEVMTASNHAMILQFRRHAWESPSIRGIFGGKGLNEFALVWEDEDTGAICKAMIDRACQFDDGVSWIWDAKSSIEGTPHPLRYGRECHKYGGHIQGAFYIDGLNAVHPRDVPREFGHVVFEKSEPFLCYPCRLPHSTLEQGRMEYKALLAEYVTCRERDEWPGYPQTIEDVLFPEYAFREDV